MKAKTIAICNRKGGVGKTITTLSMAVGLAKVGKKVLVIDCDDSNPSLTKALGLEYKEDTLSDLMLFASCGKFKSTMVDETIISVPEQIDIITADDALAGVTDTLNSSRKDEEKFRVLKQITESLKDRYDYIILDSAPSLNILTLNIFTAADEVIVVTQAQLMADAAIPEVLTAILESKRLRNPQLQVKGLLITMVDAGLKSSRDMADTMRAEYSAAGMHVYNTCIPRGSAAEKFMQSQKSVLSFRPYSNVAKAYRAFVQEYLKEERENGTESR